MQKRQPKKTAAKNGTAVKIHSKPQARKGKRDVGGDVKPKKAINKPAVLPHGQGKQGKRRCDAWAAILSGLQVNKVYSRGYLNKQMVRQYKTGSVPNHHWWVGVYVQMCVAMGMMARVDDGYVYAGLQCGHQVVEVNNA